MADQRKQKTTPKGIDPKTGKPFEPIEIPVSKRGDFEGALRKLARADRPDPAPGSGSV
jgi:hypothetical protein